MKGDRLGNTEVKPNTLLKPPVKETQKKQPYYVWRCTYVVGKRRKKKCNYPIEGSHRGLVDHSSDQHWQKHIAEAELNKREVKQ